MLCLSWVLVCLLLIIVLADDYSSNKTTSSVNSTKLVFSVDQHINTTSVVPRLSGHSCGIRRDDLSNSTSFNRPVRILLSASNAYLRPLLNWLIYFHNVCPDTSLLYIVCLDKDIELALPKYGLSCAKVIHISHTAGNIWLWRARVVKDLLAHRYDVLMTDTDAIWLRNPFIALESYPKSDIISSRGAFPESISRQLGACLCLGFIYIKASANSVMLWDDLLMRMQESKGKFKDDQLEFNQLLRQSHLHYKEGKVNVTIVNNTIPNTGKFMLQLIRPMTVTLLPHNQFMRECSGRSVKILDSTVAHCIAVHKTGASKESAMRAYGLFALRKSWQEVTVNRFDEYLPRITEPGSTAMLGRSSS